jgi:hypothetical protein
MLNPLALLVRLQTRFTCVVIIVTVLFILLGCIFGLPAFDLNRPDAGLRIRDNVEARRADSFDVAFQELFLRRSAGRAFVAQTQPLWILELYYESRDDESVFSARNLRAIQQLEWKILSDNDYTKHCLIDEASRVCADPLSVTQYFFDNPNPQNSSIKPIGVVLGEMRSSGSFLVY